MSRGFVHLVKQSRRSPHKAGFHDATNATVESGQKTTGAMVVANCNASCYWLDVHWLQCNNVC